jgi:hypothetical protein
MGAAGQKGLHIAELSEKEFWRNSGPAINCRVSGIAETNAV